MRSGIGFGLGGAQPHTVRAAPGQARDDHPVGGRQRAQYPGEQGQRCGDRDRRVDFCAASQPLAGGDLCGRELLREEVLLTVPQGHAWAVRRSVRGEELAREPFVVPRPGYGQRALADRLFERAGVLPTIVYEGDEPGALQDLVGAGLGAGLIPDMAREAGTRAGVAWLRVEAGDCERVLSLVWHRDAHLSPAARRFRDVAAGFFAAPSGAAPGENGCPSVQG